MEKERHGCAVSDIEESFEIAGNVFEIIAQSDSEFSIRVRSVVPDGTGHDWIREPNSRFETLGGARLAILTYLETEN